MTSAGRPDAVRFDDPRLLEFLDAGADPDGFDFGVIAMDRDGTVVAYNRFESERAGLRPERAVGRNFFLEVGPCTNNYLVMQRYVDAAEQDVELDEQLDYVFTFRMRPTPVRLRLLAAAGSSRQYLLVVPR